MALPDEWDIEIPQGADYVDPIVFTEEGGAVVEDLILTNNAATVSSATAPFVASMVGWQVATSDGTGIADGTTILSVQSATAATLSANASASGTKVAIIGALDASAWADVAAAWKSSPRSSSSVAITVDDSRADVGFFTLRIADTVTATMSGSGIWDMRATIDGDKTVVQRGTGDVIEGAQ